MLQLWRQRTQCRSRSCSKVQPMTPHVDMQASIEEPSLLLCEGNKEAIHPTVVGVANNQRFCILLDNGTGSIFMPSKLINFLGTQSNHWDDKTNEILSTALHRKISVYKFQISSTDSIYLGYYR